jgi:hypothetical protein
MNPNKNDVVLITTYHISCEKKCCYTNITLINKNDISYMLNECLSGIKYYASVFSNMEN